jgi:sec-independent protein translocase protein TatA
MSLFAIFGLGPMEIGIVVLLGVLLFGKKLPDIGRSVGKSITEFRNGMKGVESDPDAPAQAAGPARAAEAMRAPQKVAATAPKFEDAVQAQV